MRIIYVLSLYFILNNMAFAQMSGMPSAMQGPVASMGEQTASIPGCPLAPPSDGKGLTQLYMQIKAAVASCNGQNMGAMGSVGAAGSMGGAQDPTIQQVQMCAQEQFSSQSESSEYSMPGFSSPAMNYNCNKWDIASKASAMLTQISQLTSQAGNCNQETKQKLMRLITSSAVTAAAIPIVSGGITSALYGNISDLMDKVSNWMVPDKGKIASTLADKYQKFDQLSCLSWQLEKSVFKCEEINHVNAKNIAANESLAKEAFNPKYGHDEMMMGPKGTIDMDAELQTLRANNALGSFLSFCPTNQQSDKTADAVENAFNDTCKALTTYSTATGKNVATTKAEALADFQRLFQAARDKWGANAIQQPSDAFMLTGSIETAKQLDSSMIDDSKAISIYTPSGTKIDTNNWAEIMFMVDVYKQRSLNQANNQQDNSHSNDIMKLTFMSLASKIDPKDIKCPSSLQNTDAEALAAYIKSGHDEEVGPCVSQCLILEAAFSSNFSKNGSTNTINFASKKNSTFEKVCRPIISLVDSCSALGRPNFTSDSQKNLDEFGQYTCINLQIANSPRLDASLDKCVAEKGINNNNSGKPGDTTK